MERLVSKAKGGNKKAFLQLVDNRLDILYKIAFSYFKNKEDASDAVQDSIVTAFEKISGLKDNSKFNAWLTSILVNRCRDMLRKSNKIKFEELADERMHISSSSYDTYSKVDTSIDILNSLSELDEKHRDVITLKYLGDYSINEISKALNIPEGTVKSRLNTGLKKLRAIMEVKNDGMQSGSR